MYTPLSVLLHKPSFSFTRASVEVSCSMNCLFHVSNTTTGTAESDRSKGNLFHFHLSIWLPCFEYTTVLVVNPFSFSSNRGSFQSFGSFFKCFLCKTDLPATEGIYFVWEKKNLILVCLILLLGQKSLGACTTFTGMLMLSSRSCH